MARVVNVDEGPRREKVVSNEVQSLGVEEQGSHRLRGVLNLVSGIVLVAAVVFGITAGVGAIWTKVTGHTTTVAAPSAATVSGATVASVVAMKLSVNPPPLGGVKGSDGQVHDAFVPGSFTMKVGTTYDVTVLNYDTQAHSWVSPSLSVSASMPAGSASSPSVTHFTIKPTAAGTFQWFCATPCDKWAMTHNGFMRGLVTVTKA